MSESDPPVSTGSGDEGMTNLLGGGRVAKDDKRIALLGEVDEASASLGIARAETEDREVKELLLELLRLLYRVMGDLAMPEEQNAVGPEDASRVDEALEEWRERTERDLRGNQRDTTPRHLRGDNPISHYRGRCDGMG